MSGDTKTVLITGGTGFIGSYVANEFLNNGYSVIVCDISDDMTILKRMGIADLIEFQCVDVTDPADIEEVLRETEAEYVVHLASLLLTASDSNPKRALEVNVNGTNNLFEVAREIDDQLERIVWASSDAVYAEADRYADEFVDEDDLLYPNTLYGATKEYNEYQARQYVDIYGLDIVGLRPGVVYGPYRETGGSAFLMDIIEKPARGESHSIDCGGEYVDWLYARDLARAFRLAVEVPEENLSRRVYNVTGDICTVERVVDIVNGSVSGPELVTVTRDGTLPWDHTNKKDGSRAKTDLGYEPEYDAEAGVSEYLSEIRTA